MPYNPGISYDSSGLATGLMQGLGALAEGIMQRAAKRREKEQLAKAVETFQPLIERLAPGAGVKLDQDLPKEAIPQVINIASRIEQQQREAPLKALQIENEKLRQRISQQEIDQAAADAAATQEAGRFIDPVRRILPDPAAVKDALRIGASISAASTSPDYAAAQSAYLKKGGRDPRFLAELGALAQAQAKGHARTPAGLQDFGQDAWGRRVQGLVDAQGNVSRIQPPTSERDAVIPFEMAGKTFYRVGSAVFDASGKPVTPERERPLEPVAMESLYRYYTMALDDVKSADKAADDAWFDAGRKEAGARGHRAREKANLYAKRLGFAEPFPPSGAQVQPAAPAITKGTRVKQGGIVYEFDGQHYNPLGK